jgi:hypothetical protein
MQQTTPLTIEHVVVASEQPFEQVIAALEARLGPPLAACPVPAR